MNDEPSKTVTLPNSAWQVIAAALGKYHDLHGGSQWDQTSEDSDELEIMKMRIILAIIDAPETQP